MPLSGIQADPLLYPLVANGALGSLCQSLGYGLERLSRDGQTRICSKRAGNHRAVDDVKPREYFPVCGWLAGIENAAKFVHHSFLMRGANRTASQGMSDHQLLRAEHTLPTRK